MEVNILNYECHHGLASIDIIIMSYSSIFIVKLSCEYFKCQVTSAFQSGKFEQAEM